MSLVDRISIGCDSKTIDTIAPRQVSNYLDLAHSIHCLMKSIFAAFKSTCLSQHGGPNPIEEIVDSNVNVFEEQQIGVSKQQTQGKEKTRKQKGKKKKKMTQEGDTPTVSNITN